MSENNMNDGKHIMELGKQDLIFTRDCFADEDGLALKLTPQFLHCWKEVTKDVNYQKEFHTYILKALVMHYEKSMKVTKDEWDTDKMASIACLLDNMKRTLFQSQTNIMGFCEEDNQ